MNTSTQVIRLGSINGSHGIKGWVKVFSETDPRTAILDYTPWILRKGRSEKKIEVLDGQQSGKRLVVSLEGIDSRNLAEELIGSEIFVEKTALPALEEGAYYWHQLEGLKVQNSSGDVFGVIDHLLETGANDVMVVRACEGSVDSKQRLIPYVEGNVVLSIDLDVGLMIVDWEADY